MHTFIGVLINLTWNLLTVMQNIYTYDMCTTDYIVRLTVNTSIQYSKQTSKLHLNFGSKVIIAHTLLC